MELDIIQGGVVKERDDEKDELSLDEPGHWSDTPFFLVWMVLTIVDVITDILVTLDLFLDACIASNFAGGTTQLVVARVFSTIATCVGCVGTLFVFYVLFERIGRRLRRKKGIWNVVTGMARDRALAIRGSKHQSGRIKMWKSHALVISLLEDVIQFSVGLGVISNVGRDSLVIWASIVISSASMVWTLSRLWGQWCQSCCKTSSWKTCWEWMWTIVCAFSLIVAIISVIMVVSLSVTGPVWIHVNATLSVEQKTLAFEGKIWRGCSVGKGSTYSLWMDTSVAQQNGLQSALCMPCGNDNEDFDYPGLSVGVVNTTVYTVFMQWVEDTNIVMEVRKCSTETGEIRTTQWKSIKKEEKTNFDEFANVEWNVDGIHLHWQTTESLYSCQ